MNQLGLPISLDSKMLLDNFVGNKELLEFIDQFYEKKNSIEIYVYGHQGLGKTHVLQGAVLKALSYNQNAIYIDCNDSLPEHILDSIDQLNSFIKEYSSSNSGGSVLRTFASTTMEFAEAGAVKRY